MQYGAPEVVVRPSDPWTIPGADPWTTATETRSRFSRNYAARDFQPAEKTALNLRGLYPGRT